MSPVGSPTRMFQDNISSVQNFGGRFRSSWEWRALSQVAKGFVMPILALGLVHASVLLLPTFFLSWSVLNKSPTGLATETDKIAGCSALWPSSRSDDSSEEMWIQVVSGTCWRHIIDTSVNSDVSLVSTWNSLLEEHFKTKRKQDLSKAFKLIVSHTNKGVWIPTQPGWRQFLHSDYEWQYQGMIAWYLFCQEQGQLNDHCPTKASFIIIYLSLPCRSMEKGHFLGCVVAAETEMGRWLSS